MHYIRQLFEGKTEDWIHALFTKYGRGDFAGPACEVGVGKDIKFTGSVEYCTTFGWLAASSGGDFKAEGGIYSKVDFREVLERLGVDFDDKSKEKQGYFVAALSGELKSDVLVEVYEKTPHATVLLNLTGGKVKFKCKKKPPKPGGDKEVKFCSGALDASVLGKLKSEIFFDLQDLKKAKVEHRIIVEDLVIPAGMDAREARLQAERKGKIVRTVTVDGVEKKSECKFQV
ncbi:MAG: hypothetical protein V1744_00460 [Candidatus Altiarchaeota archaeon]